MNPIAKIGLVIRGEYDNSDTYDFFDLVFYNGATYICKKITTGNAPVRRDEYWQIFAEGIISDVSDAAITFEQASDRVNVASGEKVSTFAGKIKKFFADLKSVAFTGKYADLEERLTLTNNFMATVPGTALDAMCGKELKDENTKIKADLAAVNSNLANVFTASATSVDLANITALNPGIYSIGQSTPNKPAGVLDFGILIVMKRGANAGFILSWNNGPTPAIRLHVFLASLNYFIQIYPS